MPQEAKPCLACFEPIQQAARKCPHCHQIQTGPAALLNSPWLGWVVVGLVIAIVAVLGYGLLASLASKTAMPQLVVGPATLRASSDAAHPRVSCFAPLTNNELAVVSDPSLQAVFFDAGSNQIDVHYERHHFSVFPAQVAEGRVSGPPNAGMAEYKSCKLVVLDSR